MTAADLAPLLADSYKDSALAGLDMRVMTETLETVRSAVAEPKGQYRVWDALDEQIGKAGDPPFTGVLMQLRERYAALLQEQEEQRLRRAFERDAAQGFQEWLRTFAESWAWSRLTLCSAFSRQDFAFPSMEAEPLALLRRELVYVLEERYNECEELLRYLCAHPAVQDDDQITILLDSAVVEIVHRLDFPEGLRKLEQAKNLAPDDPRVLDAFGTYWLQKADEAQAMEYFQRAVDKRSLRCYGYLGMGDSYFQKNEFSAAEEWYRKAMRLYPGEKFAYTRLARVLGRPETLAANAEACRRLVDKSNEVEPTRAYMNELDFGYLFQQAKDFNTAHSCFDRAIASAPLRFIGYCYQGQCFLDEEKAEDAAAMYRRATSLAPTAGEGYWGLGQAEEKLERLAEAVAAYNLSIERRPEWRPYITVRLAQISWRQGAMDEAENLLYGVLRADLDNGPALDALTGFAADYYDSKKTIARALRIYQTLREIKGEKYESTYQNLVGNAYYARSEYGTAAAAYRNAIKTKDDDAVTHSNLAQALVAMATPGHRGAEIAEAITELQAAIKFAPETSSYVARLEDLQSDIDMLHLYGEAVLDLGSPPAMIQFEISRDLVSTFFNDGPVGPITEPIAAMRRRIGEKYQVTVPGMNFSDPPDLAHAVSCCRFQIAGVAGATSKPPDSGVLDPVAFHLDHLEAFIENHLAALVGHQAISFWLRDNAPAAFEKVGANPEQLTVLVQLARGLLSERISLQALAGAADQALLCYRERPSLTAITESILPPRVAPARAAPLDSALEAHLRAALRAEAPEPYLELTFAYADALVSALDGNTAVIVGDKELRPLIAAFAASEGIGVTVLVHSGVAGIEASS